MPKVPMDSISSMHERELGMEARSLLASATDSLNTWARESGVSEAVNEKSIHEVIDRLWSHHSKSRHARAIAADPVRRYMNGKEPRIGDVVRMNHMGAREQGATVVSFEPGGLLVIRPTWNETISCPPEALTLLYQVKPAEIPDAQYAEVDE
jgi:hypothetical protein